MIDTQTLRHELAVRLRTARLASGLPAHEVARQLGICRATLLNWEYGYCEPTVSNLIRLAAVYRVAVVRLLPTRGLEQPDLAGVAVFEDDGFPD